MVNSYNLIVQIKFNEENNNKEFVETLNSFLSESELLCYGLVEDGGKYIYSCDSKNNCIETARLFKDLYEEKINRPSEELKFICQKTQEYMIDLKQISFLEQRLDKVKASFPVIPDEKTHSNERNKAYLKFAEDELEASKNGTLVDFYKSKAL